MGAAFFNAGCVTLITLLLMRLCKLPMHGNGISTASLMAGFSFFGKNIVNMWFMLPGTILYARIRKEPLSKYLTFSLMSTSLGPLISSLLFANGFSGKSFLLALLTGTLIGFVAPPLCLHTNTLLHGLNLYNGGFAIGLLAMLLGSVCKCFGYTFENGAALVHRPQSGICHRPVPHCRRYHFVRPVPRSHRCSPPLPDAAAPPRRLRP